MQTVGARAAPGRARRPNPKAVKAMDVASDINPLAAHPGDAAGAPAPARAPFDAVVAQVYDELRALARGMMRHERAGHTLQATALVHEAYVRLLGQHNLDPADRDHFLAAAATTIRRVLVDHAKRFRAAKRGGGGGSAGDGPAEATGAWQRVAHAELLGRSAGRDDPLDLLALDEALVNLARVDARGADVVTMRCF